MKEEPQSTSPFDTIRQVDENNIDFWSARDLYKILGYSEWRNFTNTVLKRAEKACEQNGQAISDHFVRSYKMIVRGKGAQKPASDVHLSRYAAYLVVMNGDPHMEVVALGQAYFAVQTRKQELAESDALAELSEDQKRLLIRGQLSSHNVLLAETANNAGVITAQDFAIFQNVGYKGLYGGLGASAIHQKKGLKKSQKILDHMNSSELAANLFKSTLTEDRIRNKAIADKETANQEHFDTGREIRDLIQRSGGTLPEDQPTPIKSIQQIQREAARKELSSSQD